MESLVSTDWLAAELSTGAADLHVLDASLHLPDSGRDAEAEFADGHIPSAQFLDLAHLIDPTAIVSNTLPTAGMFAKAMATLGISNYSRIVFYDNSNIHSSARAWFMARLYGARNVAILDGGLARWRSEGRAVESGASSPVEPGHFTARIHSGMVMKMPEILANITAPQFQLVDARGPARFAGTTPEPRPDVGTGHIPGARNVPHSAMFAPDGKYKDAASIRSAFEAAGVNVDKPIVTSCGSGITACVLAFALDRAGIDNVAIYDGSWAEWGADPSTPKETGPC